MLHRRACSRNSGSLSKQTLENQTLNESKVSDFIRDYLTLKEKDIPNKGAVYEKFKERFPFLIRTT